MFEEIYAAYVLFQVGLGYLHNVLELLFVVFVVPDQDCQEVVGGVEGSDRHIVVCGERGHQLQKFNDDVVVVLTFDEVLVELEVFVFFCDNEEGAVAVDCLVDELVPGSIHDLGQVEVDLAEGVEILGLVEVEQVGYGVGLVHHADGQLGQFLDNCLLGFPAFVGGFHGEDLLVVGDVFLDGGGVQVKQHTSGGFGSLLGQVFKDPSGHKNDVFEGLKNI